MQLNDFLFHPDWLPLNHPLHITQRGGPWHNPAWILHWASTILSITAKLLRRASPRECSSQFTSYSLRLVSYSLECSSFLLRAYSMVVHGSLSLLKLFPSNLYQLSGLPRRSFQIPHIAQYILHGSKSMLSDTLLIFPKIKSPPGT